MITIQNHESSPRSSADDTVSLLPRYFVYADLQLTEAGVNAWRFVVESLDGGSSNEASDVEPNTVGERLELLAVVRALESFEHAADVILLTPSQYVVRGIRYGLDAWRESEWCWERFGRMVPVKNADLWARLDRALTYHQVRCRRAPNQTQRTQIMAVGSVESSSQHESMAAAG